MSGWRLRGKRKRKDEKKEDGEKEGEEPRKIAKGQEEDLSELISWESIKKLSEYCGVVKTLFGSTIPIQYCDEDVPKEETESSVRLLQLFAKVFSIILI